MKSDFELEIVDFPETKNYFTITKMSTLKLYFLLYFGLEAKVLVVLCWYNQKLSFRAIWSHMGLCIAIFELCSSLIDIIEMKTAFCKRSKILSTNYDLKCPGSK